MAVKVAINGFGRIGRLAFRQMFGAEGFEIVADVYKRQTLDKLAILTESKAVVLREGKKWSISTEKLVLDDILFLKTGDQVPADAKVLEGSIEVNESLLTGESDNLQKNEGDELFSGSFVTSGEACCQVIHVGKDNYASRCV